ncbi:Predicted oxidoreductase [Ceraceosorus bombacis]|uniref:Predicted oxidoreductase n=1 Tax=Ceraceosorus bombacis TaxID=401625 RepID=A0A0P1BFP7_9BASI|nr:Predicted oxidoreductase [Ceraceosorus bombacis]
MSVAINANESAPAPVARGSAAPIPVALIGYGSSARTFHLPLILSSPQDFILHTIQQRPGSKSGPDASARFPDVKVAPTFESVFDHLPKGSLVVITTANATHRDFAVHALDKGCHVVIEKPAALTNEEAESIKEAERRNGVVCTAYQNRRLDGDYLTLLSLLRPSSSDHPSPIGAPVSVESRFDRFRPLRKGGWREEKDWEEGGGVLWDLGAHLVDQALDAFGVPERITAFATSGRDASHNVEDDFLVHFHYPPSAPLPPDSIAPPPGTKLGGLRATLSASCIASKTDGEQIRWNVCGTRGSYEKRGLDPQENQLKAGSTPLDASFGSYGDSDPLSIRLGRLTTSAAPAAVPSAGANGAAPVQPLLTAQDIPTLPGTYGRYYQNVARAIRGEEKVFVSTDDIVRNTKALLLARKSVQEWRSIRWDEA